MIQLRTLAFAAALVFGAASASAETPDPVLASVLAGPQRSETNRARDVWRHPAETLAFWGLRPGVTVLELNPGGGWWTEILAPYARRTGGRYLATGTDVNAPGVSEAQKEGLRRFQTQFGDPAVFGKVEIVPFGPGTRGLGPANSVDLVITARNVHNWIATGRLDAVFADAFAVLRPGGVLGVKDHRSDPRPMKAGASDGYVSEAFVIAAAEKAGFRLDARSEINANPKDHPFGVWSLPPTRRSSPLGQADDPLFDHAPYDAVGESDRMTLRFRKPG